MRSPVWSLLERCRIRNVVSSLGMLYQVSRPVRASLLTQERQEKLAVPYSIQFSI